MRAGAQALSLLSVPLNVEILQALEPGPVPLMDLRRMVGSRPQTTMRVHLRTLTELGILERGRQAEFPGTVHYRIGTPGQRLLEVAAVIQAWLDDAPGGPLQLGGVAARSTIKALVGGWSSSIVRALAARPLSLTELSKLIGSISYPSLERRLVAMRVAGLIEASPAQSRGTPYAVTGWMRRAMAPVSAAMRWERMHAAETSPAIGRVDIEAVFLLAVPPLGIASELAGSARLAVELRTGDGRREPVGVMVSVEQGRVASCVARLQGNAAAWATGPPLAWLEAVIEEDFDALEIGGDHELLAALLGGLHRSLFGARQYSGKPLA